MSDLIKRRTPLVLIDKPYRESDLENDVQSEWEWSELGQNYVLIGNQIATSTGPLDLLAESKDGKTLLVIELKLKATDSSIGQVARYMASIKQTHAKKGQKVKGLILSPNITERLSIALKVISNITALQYN